MGLKSSNKVETNVCELEITIDAADFKQAVLKVFNKQKGSISVPGFRKGKVPMSMVEKIYGKDVFYQDALETLFPEAVEAAYKEGNIIAVDSPYDVDVKEIGEDGVCFTLKVTVKPEVEISDYKGLEAEKSEVVFSQAEADAELDRLRERNSRVITVEDRTAQNGDITSIDFEGFADGVPFEGGKGENYSLTIGSGSFIPGFEDQIIGHNIDDEFDVNVTFPEDYAPELAGKSAVFKVKLHEIKVKELPEIDDEFAKDLGEYETVDDLKKGIEKDILERKQKEADSAFESQILEAVANNLQGEIPEAMFKKRAADNTEDFSRRVSQQGADLDTYLMYMGIDKETFDAQMLEQAQKQVKLQLALEKIGELEGLEVTEEDYAAEYQKLAEMYSMDIETLKGIIPGDNMKADLINEKAVKFVIDNAKVAAKKPAAESAEDEAPADEKPKKTTVKKAAKKQKAEEAE